MSPFIFIAFSTIFGICGQLSLKRGMSRIGASTPDVSFLAAIIKSPWVVGGLLVYGIGVIFWMLALSYFEISYVYPFASLSYIGIVLGSYFIFRERLNLARLMGIAMIIAGVLIISQT
jgi:multidrug transporter EmrE-like cation transporter